ncbi:hypothetical protein CYY_010469 [Polysphondylium violaceum]|uniref:ADF-H domain-containing protein n=1 Tax=Polysphondylium violaceum TaxID=133409 RepID=A0A8J4PK39_9MYCE|nr:hypothetical protein CYY_010469 [Polysphondylium violaceum]
MRAPENVAIVFMIERSTFTFKVEEVFENISLEKLTEELSDTSPRYIVYISKYTHPDGRVSYPMVFIYFMPKQINPSIAMIYSTNKVVLVNKLEINKCFDASALETLTTPWLVEKLAFFK